jgi:hypothetical protein
MATDITRDGVDAQLRQAGVEDREHVELVLDTGLAYADGEPVRVHVRKRGFRFDLDDCGSAARKSGIDRLSRRERETAEAAALPMNVSGLGAVFVPAVEGRDIADLALRVADASRAMHEALVELR